MLVISERRQQKQLMQAEAGEQRITGCNTPGRQRNRRSTDTAAGGLRHTRAQKC